MFGRKRQKNRKQLTAGNGQLLWGEKLPFHAREAYKLLRTNVVFSLPDDEKCKVIGITSALPGEGKSSTAINLAYELAQSGKEVLLIDGDMRKPVLEQRLQLKTGAPGLSHVLTGSGILQDAVQKSGIAKHLSVITSGEIPPNPTELLASQRMEKMLKVLKEVFEYILIDLPPVNVVADGLAVSKLLSGMLVVVRQDYCDKYALEKTVASLQQLQINILGFVMNDATTKRSGKQYGKGYQRYGYGYGIPRHNKE